jgi:hypothetical protein
MTTTPTEKCWGGKKFLPGRFDPREAKPWLAAVWARYMDMKSVSFQPKPGVSTSIAMNHIQALMNTDEVDGGRRFLAAGYLCSLWFDSFEIEVDAG